MNGYETSDEHRPLLWLGGYPVYAAHFVVLVFVVSLLVSALLVGTGYGNLLDSLAFISTNVLKGEVWRVVTYGLVNRPTPSLQFIFDMAMIVWFGREVEKHFGRASFLRLYACLYLLTPAILTVIGWWRPSALQGEHGAFALFIAFATLYPNVPIFFNVLAKWAAIVLVAFYSILDLTYHDVVGLVSLWSTTGFAFCYVRYAQGRWSMPKVNLSARQTKLRALPDLPKSSGSVAVVDDSSAEIDALLDKIARSGMNSLSAKEKAKLEAAREDLLKRKSSRT